MPCFYFHSCFFSLSLEQFLAPIGEKNNIKKSKYFLLQKPSYFSWYKTELTIDAMKLFGFHM